MREQKTILQNIDWLMVTIYLVFVVVGWLNIYAAVYNDEHKNILDLTQNYGKQTIWICSAILLALGGQRAQRDRPPLVTRHSLREARQPGRILLVEDNGVNRLVATRLLEQRGHTVVAATNGREALAILDDTAIGGFAGVLMDVQMPEMDGFECTRIIREREQKKGGRLPIIAMTAHAMKGDDARCLAAGMDGYLSKPIRPDEFFDVIERHLNFSRLPASPPVFSVPNG